MKKLLVLLLLMVSTNVFAEWTRVGDTEGFIEYVDFGTIKRKGNKVKMWSMLDYKTVHKISGVSSLLPSLSRSGVSSFLSSLDRDEYDCEEETIRMLDTYLYSGNMKTGEIVYSSSNIKIEAQSIIPGSVDVTFKEIACAKK